MTQNTEPTIKEILDSAAAAIKHGDIASGKASLARVLHMEPDNVWAWLWMSRCFQDREKKLQCFKKVLEIDPKNKHALEGIRTYSLHKQAEKEETVLQMTEVAEEETYPNRRIPMADFDTISSSKPRQTSYLSRVIAVSLYTVLILAVVWLYIEVGRINLPNEFTPTKKIITLASRVDTNKSSISTQASRVDANNASILSLATSVDGLASWLSSVAAIAENANRWAHSHPYSDLHLKINTTPIENALENTLALHGITFYWNQQDFPGLQPPQGRQIGLIAQEVENIYPELVFTLPGLQLVIVSPMLFGFLIRGSDVRSFEHAGSEKCA